MARSNVSKAKRAERAAPLAIGLADPGLTPMLRAGLGGLAASVRAHAIETRQDWTASVRIGPGRVAVEPRSVRIEWGEAEPVATLEALFAASFRISSSGIIDLPGTYERTAPPSLALAAALQDGLKRTFLQHGKSCVTNGAAKTCTVEIDDVPGTFRYQPYAAFAHQHAFADVEKARVKGEVTLAGWAYPGAVARHIDWKATELRYDVKSALCACFAIVGCLSYPMPRTSGGALIIPEPTDLVRFAHMRPSLTPSSVADVFLPGPSDGVLAVHLALRMDEIARPYRGGIGSVRGVQLKTLPWAKQQKTRHGIVASQTFTDTELDRYDLTRKTLPSKLKVKKDDGTVFGWSSSLRAFITENLAQHMPWYRGFASATDGGKQARFIHYYRESKNLGALFLDEREGLIAMLNQLEDAELALVRAVHIAVRKRFGAIAAETTENAATRKNRWKGERDRWRHAFSGSKTPEQIRAALADLWSRAGSNEELRAHWEQVIPLLRPAHWKTARDLALVALASYRGTSSDEDTLDAAADDEDDGDNE
jgi:CRISPR-associated protein Cas8a1/Csx13